jgi:predicted CxxxxCH...CXXCH cytochrome family protein
LIVRFELEVGRELLLLMDSYWTANLLELVHQRRCKLEAFLIRAVKTFGQDLIHHIVVACHGSASGLAFESCKPTPICNDWLHCLELCGTMGEARDVGSLQSCRNLGCHSEGVQVFSAAQKVEDLLWANVQKLKL